MHNMFGDFFFFFTLFFKDVDRFGSCRVFDVKTQLYQKSNLKAFLNSEKGGGKGRKQKAI